LSYGVFGVAFTAFLRAIFVLSVGFFGTALVGGVLGCVNYIIQWWRSGFRTGDFDL
jgi:hypothetical protein